MARKFCRFCPANRFLFLSGGMDVLYKVKVRYLLMHSFIEESEQKQPLLLTGPQGWYLGRPVVNPHFFAVVTCLALPLEIQFFTLEKALQYVVNYHEALRTRFLHDEAGWRQYFLVTDSISCLQVDLSSLTIEVQAQVFDNLSTQLQSELNLFNGPVFKTVLFRYQKSTLLLLVLHHLIVDAYSAGIVIEDIQQAYIQLSRGEQIQLATKTTSLQNYITGIAEYLRLEQFRREADYWFSMPWGKVAPLPKDFPTEENTIGSSQVLQEVLSIEESDILLQVLPRMYRVQTMDVLLTAFVQTFAQWTSHAALQVSIVFSGRMIEEILQDVKLARTVGFISCGTELLVLDIEQALTPLDQLKAVQQQMQRLPYQGVGAQWLLYLCEDGEIQQRKRQLPRHELVFNYFGKYLGQGKLLSGLSGTGTTSSFDGGADLSLPFEANCQDPRNPRNGVLIFQAGVIDNRLAVSWEYSTNQYRLETIKYLSQCYLESLRLFIRYGEKFARTMPKTLRNRR